MAVAWEPAGDYEDILYGKAEGMARISINRPEVHNAFRPETVFELIDAFQKAREDPEVGVVLFTGEGGRAFCSGGDQRVRGHGGYVGEDDVARINVTDLHKLIRSIPIPVIALVAGWSIGGGHVLHVICDPHHRRRERALRSDRPARRFLRRRLRGRAAGPPRRPEEGARDLVPLPPVRRAGGA